MCRRFHWVWLILPKDEVVLFVLLLASSPLLWNDLQSSKLCPFRVQWVQCRDSLFFCSAASSSEYFFSWKQSSVLWPLRLHNEQVSLLTWVLDELDLNLSGLFSGNFAQQSFWTWPGLSQWWHLRSFLLSSFSGGFLLVWLLGLLGTSSSFSRSIFIDREVFCWLLL